MGRFINMTGWIMKEHGVPDSRLTVIKIGENSHSGHIRWHCKCECGNECHNIDGRDLRNGHTKSCGCLQKERTSEASFKDIAGKRFGKLIALYPLQEGRGHDKMVIWHCKCDCGNECDVIGTYLRTNGTKSCGCLGHSTGEWKIQKLLEDNSFIFEKEKKFEDCKDKQALRFDFYVNNKYIIEYDGKQHFCYSTGWSTEAKFFETQKHDKMKNQYCFNNNIPIIRIPYWHYDNLCLEDLMPETSHFLLKYEE